MTAARTDWLERSAGLVMLALVALVLALAPAHADPKFPPLTGRVVDAANILPPATVVDLTTKLAALEARTGRQFVVATVPDLQGYDIADYGYRLGRAWAIGAKGRDDGVLFVVAPTERKSRFEVGYGLEGVLTDALTSLIFQREVRPRFKAGDYPGGIMAGTDAVIAQLELPADQARANLVAAEQAQAKAGKRGSAGPGAFVWIILILLFFVLPRLMGGGRSGRRGGMPIIFWGGGGGGGGGWGGGGFGGGGGGFSGGGGSFGGGGSSGSW